MKLRWDKWLYGLGSAAIGGGSSAVVSAISTMIVSPSTFNVGDWDGATKVLTLMGINFILTGAFSMFFFLKQSPLPDTIGDTEFYTKQKEHHETVN